MEKKLLLAFVTQLIRETKTRTFDPEVLEMLGIDEKELAISFPKAVREGCDILIADIEES